MVKILRKFSFANFFQQFFQDQDQDSNLKFNDKIMLHLLKIPTKFFVLPQKKSISCPLSKSKSWLGSGGAGSGFYFGFQYQNYILYIEDTHQISIVSTDETYRQTVRQDVEYFFFLEF